MSKLAKHGHRYALAAISLLVLYWFFPEIELASIFYNDGVSHGAIIKGIDQAWRNGGNITDFWMDYINFGHAMLRSYQFLFHLTIWLLSKTIFAWMSFERCFNVCITLIAMAMPICFYKGCRLLGMRRLESVLAACAVVLLHEREGYGLGLTNFTYSGYGTYNQLFAMLFFPFTIAYAHRMLRTGKGALAASLAFSATFMSHILTGYFACMWILIDALVLVASERGRLKWIPLLAESAKFVALVLLWTGHWVIPMAQDSVLQHKSEFEAGWKWTGHGAEEVLTELFSGNIMDADRIPVLTIFSTIAVLFCAWSALRRLLPRRRGQPAEAAAGDALLRGGLAIQAVLWVLLTFGPETWGGVLSILPFSGTLHWHRFEAGVQIAFVMCLALALGALIRRLDLRDNQLHLGVLGAVATGMLVPCIVERQNYFWHTNYYWEKDTKTAWEKDTNHYKAALEFALSHPDARYQAGDPWTWGNSLKISDTIPFYALLVQNNVETIGAIHHHQNHTEVLAFKADVKNRVHDELMNVRYVALPSNVEAPAGWQKALATTNSVLYDNKNTTGFFAVGRDLGGEPGCADNEQISMAVPYYLGTSLPGAHVYPAIVFAKSCEGRKPLVSDQIARAEETKGFKPVPGRVLESRKEAGPGSDVHSAKVKMEEAGLLLFKMNYHPRWIARVDGKVAPTIAVIPSFLAVRLEPGPHAVELRYEVAPLKRALLWLTALGLLGLAAHSFVAVRRKLA